MKTQVWFNGEFVPLSQANVNILTHGLNYGTGVFEGVRAYWNQHNEVLNLFRAPEHYDRWIQNCGILRIEVPQTAEELTAITAELCERNGYKENVYIRPLAYKSAERLGVAANDENGLCITALPFGTYYGDRGLKAAVSSWRRVDDNSIPGRAKISGAYVNSVLAGDEARRNGHDEAILLNQDGHVAEGSTCNLFLVKNGRLVTPPVTDNILEGITRATVMELAERELGLTVEQRSVDRTELYQCEELFFTGTAVELAPVVAVDHRRVGKGIIGPITRDIRQLFEDVVYGRNSRYSHWLQATSEVEAAVLLN
jgi:branched-chain amino acid aminotransferase